MKKVMIFLLAAGIFSLATSVSADEYDHIYTNGYLNGKTFEYETDNWEGNEWAYENDVYMFGLVDALFWTNNQRMNSLYPESSYPNRQDMADAVRRYYRNNPNRSDQPIVDILLNGCK